MNSRNMLAAVAGGMIVLACATAAHAYDAETHGLITYKAFQASTLNSVASGSVVARLGLDRLDAPTPFNAYWIAPPVVPSYYDNMAISGWTAYPSVTNYPRMPSRYEQCQMETLLKAGGIDPNDPMVSGTTIPFLPIQNWLLRGVLREDDVKPRDYSFAKEQCGQPDLDPGGPITRVMNHFYDPINDQALNPPIAGSCLAIAPNGTCLKSIDWALGYVDSFATPQVVDTSRRNHFTYVDARENMWIALIGERGRTTAPPYTGQERANDAQERLYRWATTFRALGDVVHLLEDGAQPQHVRNDPHSPFVTSQEQQAYEGYTNGRVLTKSTLSGNAYVRGFFADGQDAPLPTIVTGTYPKPMFTTPLRFYSTRLRGNGPNVLPDGRYGLMDYTNRGFFTGGTLPGDGGNVFLEPPATLDAAHGYTPSTVPCVVSSDLSHRVGISCTHLMHSVEDTVSSGYVDELPHAVGQSSPFSAPPVATVAAFNFVFAQYGILVSGVSNAVGLEEFQTMANLAIPRAIGYSAGLLDYFFRGQLTVTAPINQVVAALNQGETHAMNAQGYPCVGTASNDGCAVFGFQLVRLNVQNTTPTITESGSGNQVLQNLSATAAGDPTDPNFAGPYLVAVAKFHRNACYKPDLSGERVQAYVVPPATGITEPICGVQPVRTAYQEIAVSKSVAVSAAALNGTSPTEVKFDFSSDPIPVNATDLFFQVVYRGPMGSPPLDQEPDAIAVGTLDVREPSFVGFWNNTDYWWNGGSWFPYSSTFPPDSAKDFWVCAGDVPPKLIFYYQGATGSPAMENPIAGSNHAGVVRLGILFPTPPVSNPAQRKIIRGTPVAYPIPGIPQIPVRDAFTSGAFRQANKDHIAATTLLNPVNTCAAGLPTSPEYWCFDTVLKRRSQVLGGPAQPMYLMPVGTGTDGTDVDAPPAQSAFAGIIPLVTGAVRFNTDATLATCPAQPTSVMQPVDTAHMHQIELQEEANSLGIGGEQP